MQPAILLALASIGSADAPMTVPEHPEPQVAATCFKTGERRDGMNKICYYDCLGSAYAITIGATELCPLTIRN